LLGGALLHHCRGEARHLIGEVGISGNRRHLILPQIQELLCKFGEVDGRGLLGHSGIIGWRGASSQCSYRIAKVGRKPAMLRHGRPSGEAKRPYAQRQEG